MNKQASTFTAAILSFAAMVAVSSAHADQIVKHGASAIIANISDTPEVTVRNVANSNQMKDLQLSVQENQISVGVSGAVDCKGTVSESISKREGYYLSGGAFGVGRNALEMKEDLPSSSDINHISDMDAHTFIVPIGLLDNPELDVDPVEIVMAAANAAPSKIAYLRQDHTIDVNLPVRFEATCAAYTRYKIAKETVVEGNQPKSYAIKEGKLRIHYQGDPDLQQISLKLGQAMGGNGQIQAGPQNFIQVTGGTFLQGEVHKKGSCPMDANFKLQLTGAGDGQVKIRINDGGVTIHNSQALDFTKGKVTYDFSHKLYYKMLNVKQDHNYRVYYSAKTANENFFPNSYQSLPITLDWSHTCIKEVKVNPSLQLPGQGGQFLNNNNNQGAPAKPSIKRAPSKPTLPPARSSRKLAPTTPTPVAPTLKVAPVTPPEPPKPSRITR
ncbi:hypothetical protein ACFL0R_03230 [Pseudomonadota bacterium]